MVISIIFKVVAVIRNEANIQKYMYMKKKDCTAYCGLLYSQ